MTVCCILCMQIYLTWQKAQTQRAAAAKSSGAAGAFTATRPPAAAARVPGVTDAFYTKLAAALEVQNESNTAMSSSYLKADLGTDIVLTAMMLAWRCC